MLQVTFKKGTSFSWSVGAGSLLPGNATVNDTIQWMNSIHSIYADGRELEFLVTQFGMRAVKHRSGTEYFGDDVKFIAGNL